MNDQTTTHNQLLTIISENGGIHVGWVEETQASAAPTEPIQLELDFNQSTSNNQQRMNNQSKSLLSQFSNHQFQQLRRAATLEE